MNQYFVYLVRWLILSIKYLLNFGDRLNSMNQTILHIVRWSVWYMKYRFNFGDNLHTVRLSLQPLNANPEAPNFNITALGNGIVARMNHIQINQENGNDNGICIVQVKVEVVLPLDITTMTINRNGNGDPGWFLRWIEIDGGHRFSFYKTITDGVFSSRKDTLLPQDESSQYNLDLRNCYLAEQKLKYGYELYNGGDLELPVKIRNLPMEENFSLHYFVTNSVLPEARMFMSQEIVILKNWLPKRWRAFVEINTAYQMYFKTPKGNINWENDLHFAQQRLNQCNSSLIRRVIDQREIANIMNIRKRVRRHSSASMSEKKSCVLIVTVMIVFILSEIPRLVLNTSVITTYASDLGKENIAWNKVKDEIEKESTVCFKRAEDSVLTTILSDLKFCDIEHLNYEVQTVCENKNYSESIDMDYVDWLIDYVENQVYKYYGLQLKFRIKEKYENMIEDLFEKLSSLTETNYRKAISRIKPTLNCYDNIIKAEIVMITLILNYSECYESLINSLHKNLPFLLLGASPYSEPMNYVLNIIWGNINISIENFKLLTEILKMSTVLGCASNFLIYILMSQKLRRTFCLN